MKYTCIVDVTSFDEVVIPKGTVVEAGQTFTASHLTLELSELNLQNTKLFAPLHMAVSSREHSDDADQVERDWIVEVKVRTTRARLRAIEEFLSERLPDML